ncbi:MAG: sce7726 family protein [Eubacteriaceae bacterium]|nr:sce7726 family protein [Eubacteriaceae bacterium]
MLYDKDIREPLFQFLESRYEKVRIIEEKKIGKSRADFMMVLKDSIVGIEIKSDADTYARLESQVKDYNAHFDYNVVAVGSSHAANVSTHVPEWWGIISIEEREDHIDFYILREMKRNPRNKLKKQLTMLWRCELAHIQELNGMYKYKQKSKKFVQDKIYETVDHEVLKEQLCAELFERDYTTIAEAINEYRVANGRKPKRKSRKYSKR